MFHPYLKFPLGSVSAQGFSSVWKKENALQSCSISDWCFLLGGAVLRCELLERGRIVTVCLRADYQTGMNESLYALAVWNTAVLKYMLVHLYKIYNKVSWIRNCWGFGQGALMCIDSWLWSCAVTSWLALCKKFHVLLYPVWELWYHWGYKCKHKWKSGWNSSVL